MVVDTGAPEPELYKYTVTPADTDPVIVPDNEYALVAVKLMDPRPVVVEVIEIVLATGAKL